MPAVLKNFTGRAPQEASAQSQDSIFAVILLMIAAILTLLML